MKRLIPAAVGIALLGLTAAMAPAPAAAQPSQAAPAAQAWPAKPVRVVLPYPAGGNTDVIAREVMREVSARMGQQFVVDNKPGANGNIGTDIVAKAAPDGYTFAVVIGAFALSPSLSKSLPYSQRDLAPVSLMTRTSLVLVSSQELAPKTFEELVKAGRAKSQLTFASSGAGSAAHLLGVRFAKAADFKGAHVPYKGSTDAVNDLVAGRIDFMFDAVSAMGGLVRQGRLHALAVTGTTRSAQLPGVPTIGELGYPQLATSAWSGVLAPAQTPRTIINRLATEIAAALKAPAVKEKLAGISTDTVGSTPAEFEAFIAEETRTGAEAIRQAGIVPE
ncbi:MAG: tripartite tricarboxylate transporter substrate-binding protein [Pseudomonadota bacterium]